MYQLIIITYPGSNKIFSRCDKNPSQTYLIIIEELNRANVSAVFGEMFQLLDRDSGGRSQYPIDISEDLKLYLSQEILIIKIFQMIY